MSEKVLKISGEKSTTNNPHYLGWDEDHNGDWDDYYMCPNPWCKNNYLVLNTPKCPYCNSKLQWINQNDSR